MRRLFLAGLVAWFGAVWFGAAPAVALQIDALAELDYTYSQENIGGDVNAETQYNQKYELKYETSLTSAYDFLGAVRLDLQDSWFTDQAHTSQVSPTLELQTKGSQLAARIAYEAQISSTDAYQESGEVETYSTSLTFELEATPEIWPEFKLKYQRKRDVEAYTTESTADTFEFTARKEIYDVILEFDLSRELSDDDLPARAGSDSTTWSAKAAYKEVLWGGTEFELAYELNEDYQEDQTRGVFSGETSSYNQILKTRFKNSLLIAPRATIGLAWEYQFEQDLLELDFDYKLKNKYVLDLRWDAWDWLKIAGEAQRETDLTAAAPGEDDERTVTDTLKAGFDMTSIDWLKIAGKAEFKKEGKVAADSGNSVEDTREEKYELVAKNSYGGFWDLTVNASTSNNYIEGLHTDRETKVKFDLKLKLLELIVSPSYETSRSSEGLLDYGYLISQQQIRDAKIKFEYQMQLLDMFKATFSHEYGVKIEDTLDEVLNFEEILQYNEDTRLTIALAEIVRDLRLEFEIDRKASDTEDDPDPKLVELSYDLKLDWKYENLVVLSSITYNDKGDTFDDVSFNAKAGWKGEQLELTGEYQFDKIITEGAEPMDEKRKLNLKLNYRF